MDRDSIISAGKAMIAEIRANVPFDSASDVKSRLNLISSVLAVIGSEDPGPQMSLSDFSRSANIAYNQWAHRRSNLEVHKKYRPLVEKVQQFIIASKARSDENIS